MFNDVTAVRNAKIWKKGKNSCQRLVICFVALITPTLEVSFNSLRVDLFFQTKEGSTKQRAKACYEFSGFRET